MTQPVASVAQLAAAMSQTMVMAAEPRQRLTTWAARVSNDSVAVMADNGSR